MSDSLSSHEPTIDLRWLQPGTALIVIGGEHDLQSAPDLAQAMDDAFELCNHLILDLSSAEFIDSSTINVLMKGKKRADDRGCRFNLVMGTAHIVERALEVAQVLPALNHVKTLDQALAA
jgi:anti-anti-sigma factor